MNRLSWKQITFGEISTLIKVLVYLWFKLISCFYSPQEIKRERFLESFFCLKNSLPLLSRLLFFLQYLVAASCLPWVFFWVPSLSRVNCFLICAPSVHDRLLLRHRGYGLHPWLSKVFFLLIVGSCHGLKCPCPRSPLPFICWNSALQCAGIRRWGLREVIGIRWGHGGGALMSGIRAHRRVLKELFPPFPTIRGHSRKTAICLQVRQQALTKCCYLDPGLPSHQNMRSKSLLSKHPVWGYVS